MDVTNGDRTPAERPGRRRSAILIAGILVLALLGGIGITVHQEWIAVGGSTAAANSNFISVLPSLGTRSGCISQSPSAPEAELPLANGAMQTNLYAAPNGTSGSVGMCYDADTGDSDSYVNWTTVGGKGGWFSYPQIAYGVDNFDGPTDTYTGQGGNWLLPQSEAAVERARVWVTAAYDYNRPAANTSTGDDISFDNYLTPGLPPTWKVHPWVEVLVLLDHAIWTNPQNWANWSMPTLVNSTISQQPWAIGYWCHGKNNGTSGNVTFDFSYAGSPRLVGGLAAGTLGVNLSAVMAEVELMLPSATCWTGDSSEFSSFYLGQQVFGAEAGVHTNSSFEFNWSISQYCIHVDVTDPAPTNVSCAASPAAQGSTAASTPAPSAASADGARRRMAGS